MVVSGWRPKPPSILDPSYEGQCYHFVLTELHLTQVIGSDCYLFVLTGLHRADACAYQFAFVVHADNVAAALAEVPVACLRQVEGST
ncbi:hypothetical protein KSC_046820 [Ktedonobacter sp. SOSP1-52]|nr:hypothetical protein KSC_046820 [Ktedonobacter sp. SOSP1-52]